MAATQAIRVIAKQLHEGDLVRLRGVVGVAHVEYAGGIAPSRILVRPSEQQSRWFGLATRWKTWDELHTAVEELPMDGEVEVVATYSEAQVKPTEGRPGR